MLQFSYTLAPLGLDSIRLLSLLPNRDETAPLQCELHEYPLQKSCKETHLYEALSYTWGGFDDPPQCISIDGHFLPVTSNLYAALLRLRNCTFNRIIWVDAICINQEDEQEKSRQIQMMARIYGQANRVIVYLGKAADDSDLALESIRIAANDEEEKSIIQSYEEPYFPHFDYNDTDFECIEIGTDDEEEQPINPLIIKKGEEPDLGCAADDSDLDFESVQITTDNEDEKPINPVIIKMDEKPILELLKRPWFQRIWVLQEVGLARSILILCGFAEIDGFTFCLGISKLGHFFENSSHLRSLIRATIYMIRGSIFRPKHTLSPLGDLSLGELIDMYHAHKATIRHDKVYALLGMSSDDLSSTGLLPDYTIPWKTLFQRLIEFVLCERVSVETWDDREISVIKSRGCILGHVSSVRIDSNRFHRQHINVVLNKTPISLQYNEGYGTEWTLQTSAQPIQREDLICLLEGVSKPSIIRAYKDHFAIIMIAATLRRRTQTDRECATFQQSLPSPNVYSHDLLLVWQWEEIPTQDQPLSNRLQEMIYVVPEYLKTDANKATRSYDLALILEEANNYERAAAQLQDDIRKYEEVFGRENLHIVSLKERLACIYGERKRQYKKSENLLLEVIKIRQDFQGNFHQNTLNSKAKLAMVYVAEDETPHDHWKTELTDGIKNNIQIREEVLMQAIRYMDERMLKLLLGLKKENVPITQKVIEYAAWRGRDSQIVLLLQKSGPDCEITDDMVNLLLRSCGEDVMMSLIQKRGADMEITSELLKAIASGWKGAQNMIVLLREKGADIEITNELLEIIAGIGGLIDDVPKLMALALKKRSPNMTITEAVMISAARHWYGEELMEILFGKQGAKIIITEAIIIAAIENLEKGVKIVEVLLKEQEKNITITNKVIRALVRRNKEIRERAPTKRYDPKSFGLVSKDREDIIIQLLEKRGEDMEVTEEIFRMIATEIDFGKEALTLLIGKQGAKMKVTQEMVKIVAKKYPEEAMLLAKVEEMYKMQ
ncbi:hypothetical protein EAF04_007036 [Stromatinia cepivora]|nr:hypothetical protein EAF04_007036 [Stromatinia cepivora]